MLYYVFDGSFNGLMTAISESISVNTMPENIIPDYRTRDDLFGQYITICSDESKSDVMLSTVAEKMGDESLSNILHCYLSDAPESGIIIYRYIQFGMNTGRKVNLHMTNDSVKPILDLVRKVKCEQHRMLGIVRFRLVENGLYYAAIDPDHNITGIIAPHFARRMSDQNWIIHDTRRNLAVVYDKKKWQTVDIDINHTPEDSDMELFYSDLWRSYFKKIAISGRKNPKLQKQFLPKRYWKNLTELS